MFPVFAYSNEMQLVLGVVAFICTFIEMYLIAELILALSGIKAQTKEKLLFSFIAGTMLYNAWIYGIFFLGAEVSFTPLAYALVISINPFFVYLYYLAALKIFKLTPIRSMKMMSYIYLYWTFNTAIFKLLGDMVSPVSARGYNYLLDAIRVVAWLLVFYLGTKLLQRYIDRNHTILEFVDTGLLFRKKEWLSFICRTSFIYIVNVSVTLFLPPGIASNAAMVLILVLFIVLILYMDLNSHKKQVISNQEVHISALFKAQEEFRGVKHDFYNILHTYSGYLELGEYEKLKAFHGTLVGTTSHAGTMLELSQRMAENPMLIALLVDKLSYAEKSSIKMNVSCKCNLQDFFISNIDLCRALACLLDNAIEAAALSKEKRIYFTCETKDENAILIIITNTIPAPVSVDNILMYGVTNKEGHSGIGLNIVKSTINRYENCTFRVQSSGQEFSSYIELRKR